MVYARIVLGTLAGDWTFQTHLLLNLPPRALTSTMKKIWMPDLTRRRQSRQSTNSCSCWRSKKRRASRTWPPHCHSCSKPAKGSVCSTSVAKAMEADFLPALNEDQANRFTLSELLLHLEPWYTRIHT